MQRLALLIVILIVLIGGGALSTQLLNGDASSFPAAVIQTSDIESSVFQAAPWQAQQFFLFVGFLVFNLLGIGITIALILWFLNRGVARARATEPESSDNS